MADATEGEEVVSSPQEPQQEWPPPGPLDLVLPDTHDSPDISPNSKGGPIVDDMVVAAVISLQDPVGSGADDICTWIEDHYPAVDREKVKVVMTHMVQAGRLQPVPNCPGLVRMGGVVRQLVDQEALPMHLPDDALTHEDDMQDTVINEKIVAEHAMLAAQAVAEAEETSRKASDLLDAANAVEELEHSLHDRQIAI